MNDQQRRNERARTIATVSFRRPSEQSYKVELHDLSPLGCRIDVRTRLSEGQIIWITLPGLQMQQCTVRWTDGWVAGLEFEQPLHPSVFEHLTDRIKAA